MRHTAIIVLAKAPAPGRVKTRLVPPLDDRSAAALAAAALRDTLDAVEAARVGRRCIVLDGEPSGWVRPGLEYVPQAGGAFAERLGRAFADVGGPALLIGMDTPQVTADVLEDACATLGREDVDAVLGASPDGGWWALGLGCPDRRVFDGVPMSTPRTGLAQRQRLVELGYRVAQLPPLLDVDDIADAYAVAEVAPDGRFAATLRRLSAGGEDRVASRTP